MKFYNSKFSNSVCIISAVILELFGATAAWSRDDNFHIIPLDENFNAKEMADKNVVIHPNVTKTSQAKNSNTELPTKEKVNFLLNKVGLSPEIKHMDTADRDILFLRARKYSSQKLIELYPELSAKNLIKLSEALK
jgi:hypothetical protein